jgi:acetyl-CoA carboxylase, biotin carboxylase subunit
MRRALRELRIGGIATSVVFHQCVLDEPDFLAGHLDVHYVERHPALLEAATADDDTAALAALAAALLVEEQRTRRSGSRIDTRTGGPRSRWRDQGWT